MKLYGARRGGERRETIDKKREMRLCWGWVRETPDKRRSWAGHGGKTLDKKREGDGTGVARQ